MAETSGGDSVEAVASHLVKLIDAVNSAARDIINKRAWQNQAPNAPRRQNPKPPLEEACEGFVHALRKVEDRRDLAHLIEAMGIK